MVQNKVYVDQRGIQLPDAFVLQSDNVRPAVGFPTSTPGAGYDFQMGERMAAERAYAMAGLVPGRGNNDRRATHAPAHDRAHVTARGRNGEILRRNNRTNNAPDQFEVPHYLKAPGWDYQWIMLTCHNKEFPAQLNGMMANGWRPVPTSRAPGYYAKSGDTGAIIRDGLMLCERPMELTIEAQRDQERDARAQLYDQTNSFHGDTRIRKVLQDAGTSNMGFTVPDRAHDHRGLAASRVSRTIEGVPQNMYPTRELAIGSED